MSYVIPLWNPPSLAVAGSIARFPVRNIYCIGRNYAEHAKEMGGDASKEPPFFFTKSAHAIMPDGGAMLYPLGTKNLHHEMELVVAIGDEGTRVAAPAALALVYGYAAGIDMTRRDLQQAAREIKRPWDFGKNFEQAAPIAQIVPASQCGHLARGKIWLEVNGAMRQQADLADMIWNVPDAIAFLSQYYTLYPGDLIMTGTPAGVGPLVAGDKVRGGIDGLGEIQVHIVAGK